MNIFFNRLALNEGDFSYSGHILDAMTSCVFVDRAIENPESVRSLPYQDARERKAEPIVSSTSLAMIPTME